MSHKGRFGVWVRSIHAIGIVLAASCCAASTSDLAGPWEIARPINDLKTAAGTAPPLNAEGQKQYLEHKAHLEDDPLKRCLPPGVPRTLLQVGFPFNIVAGQDYVAVMMQWNHLPRVIYLNRDHFDNVGPGYLGQSVGHWEGGVLIVDTTGYNDSTWLDNSGLPHSESLHTVERISLKSRTTLRDEITFDDPAVFSHPWKTVLLFKKRPNVTIKEDYCLGRMGIHVLVK